MSVGRSVRAAPEAQVDREKGSLYVELIRETVRILEMRQLVEVINDADAEIRRRGWHPTYGEHGYSAYYTAEAAESEF